MEDSATVRHSVNAPPETSYQAFLVNSSKQPVFDVQIRWMAAGVFWGGTTLREPPLLPNDARHVAVHPEGELVSAAATAIMPPLYQADVQLLIEALQLAAKQQQSEARKTLAAGAAVVGVLALAVGTAGK